MTLPDDMLVGSVVAAFLRWAGAVYRCPRCPHVGPERWARAPNGNWCPGEPYHAALCGRACEDVCVLYALWTDTPPPFHHGPDCPACYAETFP